MRAVIADRQKLPIAVFGYQHKAVVIVKKLCFVTVWQHLCNIGEAMRKAVLYILGRYVMPAALYAVFDAAEAFFCCVKADIVQADIIPGFLCPAAQALWIAAGKRCFLRKIHAAGKRCLDAVNGQLAALVFIAAAAGR